MFESELEVLKFISNSWFTKLSEFPYRGDINQTSTKHNSNSQRHEITFPFVPLLLISSLKKKINVGGAPCC